MEENQIVDYTDMLSICPRALEVYQQHGLTNAAEAFEIGNILNENHFYAEAAFLFRLAFDLHSQNPSEYPFRHVLWMTRLVALLMGNLPIKDDDLELLKTLSIPFYNYIIGWKNYKETGNVFDSVHLMANCYEEFPTGDGADRIYTSIIKRLFNPDLVVSANNRADYRVVANVIPNNLFMYWDENPPEVIGRNFEYHKQLGYFNLQVFNKFEAAEWLYQNYGVEARQLFLATPIPAEAADFFKLHIVNHYGGWWLNARNRIKLIDQFFSIIPTMYAHVLTSNDDEAINDNLFGSVPNSPILNECIRTLYHNCYVNPHMPTHCKTGSGIFNRAINRILYRCLKSEGANPSLTLLSWNNLQGVVETIEI